MTCIDLLDKKAWNSGEAAFRDLKGGMVKDFPIGFCRDLLLNNNARSAGQVLLERLGEKFPYEVNIGYNGKIWVRAEKAAEVIFIFNALERLVELRGSTLSDVDFIMSTLPSSETS